MGIFTNTAIPRLEQALNTTTLNQKMIAQNIANVDTPNYKAKHVSFNSELENSLNAYRTDSRHIPFSSEIRPRISVSKGTAFQNNGNNVDIDKEMADLAKNQIKYQALVQLLNNRFGQIKTVIRGGR